MACLALDYQGVLRDWEKVGSTAFSWDRMNQVEDLDLSMIEASLNPPSNITDFTFSYFHIPCFFPDLPSYSAAPMAKSGLVPVHNTFIKLEKEEPHLCGIIKEEAVDSRSTSSSSTDMAVAPDSTGAASSATSPASTPSSSAAPHSSHTVSASTLLAAQTRATGDFEPIRTRIECLERYRQKKARRLYTKKIRYQLRKINADKRPRIKGRFVKKEELDTYMRDRKGEVCLADVLCYSDDDEDLLSEFGDFSDFE